MPLLHFSQERLDKRSKTQAEQREKRQKFFIRINEKLGVSRDEYNVILQMRMTAEGSGKVYEQPLGYFGDFTAGLLTVAKEKGATGEELVTYSKRVGDFKTRYDQGRLIIEHPTNFNFDDRGITNSIEEENSPAEDV